MKYLFYSIALFSAFQSCAQSLFTSNSVRTITEADIAEHTRYFTFENEQIKGPGAKVLTRIAKNSQFIIVGESHGSSQTSNLVSAWLPVLSKYGFDNLACEVGPHSAEVLKQLSTPATSTDENLRAFHEQYYMELFEDGTIPFFDGKEDVRFLQIASEQGMDLWGLDQEYYYSILHLTEELANTKRDDSNYQSVLKAKQEVDEIIYNYFVKEDTSAIDFDAFSAILDDHEVQAFFNLFSSNNTQAQSIIASIKTSFDIYINWQRGSHADRISYMRNNLLKEVKQSMKREGQLPKVFLKFGQLHASKILSNGAYDLGHAIQNLAYRTGTKAVNIALARRFVNHNDQIVDLYKRPRNPYGQNTSLLAPGKKDEAAIIDLTSIRYGFGKEEYKLPLDGDFHRIKQVLDGFDYLIILPLDQRQQRLF